MTGPQWPKVVEVRGKNWLSVPKRGFVGGRTDICVLRGVVCYWGPEVVLWEASLDEWQGDRQELYRYLLTKYGIGTGVPPGTVA